MIGDAISEVDLDAEQEKQLYGLAESVRLRHKNVLSLRTSLAIDIATSVEGGKIDEPRVFGDAEHLGVERQAVLETDARAIENVHDTLTPKQRTAFALALRERAEHVKLDDFRTRYGTWRNDLHIDVRQDERIEPRLHEDSRSASEAQAEKSQRQKRMIELANAFERPKLVALPFLDHDVRATTEHRVHRFVAFLEVVLPELTDDQRRQAAAFIRSDAGVSVKVDADTDEEDER